MYPLAEGMFAPRNQWYVAGLADEVTRQPSERWILGEPVALYRTQEGRAVALGGRCPHRHFPLGKSGVVGDNIECGYHGLQFRPDGTAAMIPSQTAVPTACRVKAYPMIEKWKFLWIWPGDPESADEALLPDHAELGLDDPDFELCGTAGYAVPARYMLMHDNLFDLTHLNVLHRGSIAGGDLAATKEERLTEGNTLRSLRRFKNVDLPPFFAPLMNYRGKCDRDVMIKFYLPSLHYFYDRFSRAEGEPDEGAHVGEIKGYHCITPATKNSTHYFFVLSRDFGKGDADFGGMLLANLRPTLEEDVFATTEIEKMIGGLGCVPPEILLRSDTTCGHGRKLFEKAINLERDAPVRGSEPETGRQSNLHSG